MIPLKNLPIGMQTFADIINGNYVYVDKTLYIYDLVTKGKVYFFSRPRRFGKSLLISTLQALFEGKRALFKGLAIDSLDFDWIEYPVIKLVMPTLTEIEDQGTLRKRLQALMLEVAEKYNCTIAVDDPGAMLKLLISQLKKMNKVVVLIDEYDRPLLDVLTGQKKIISEIKGELHSFYSVLKDMDEHIRFVFITGISQFSKTSIFSGLNNLDNITHDEAMASLLGYTDEEIDGNFHAHCTAAQLKIGPGVSVRDGLREWYDGYRFHENGAYVYNPFSVLSMLAKKAFDNYWFSTGTPTFLVKLIAENSDNEAFMLKPFDHLEVAKEDISNLVVEKPLLIPLLYQTGYLTIESFDPDAENFMLRMPNREISRSLFRALLAGLIGNELQASVATSAKHIRSGFSDNNLNQVKEHLKRILSKIAYSIQDTTEKYYHSLFYLILTLSGCKIIVEDVTNIGRIDAVVTTETHFYIIELKVNRPKSRAEDPMAQIKEKKYYEKYLGEGKKIVLVGAVFDAVERTVTEWVVEPFVESKI